MRKQYSSLLYSDMNRAVGNEIERFASEVFEKFSSKDGSQEIARVDALIEIGGLVKSREIDSVLEIGSGIGTVVSFLQNKHIFGNLKIYGFEKNDWCREQLSKNVAEFHEICSLEELARFNKNVDLIIIDDFISSEITQSLINKVKPRFIFIEGHRRRQRLYVLESLENNDIKSRFVNFRKTSRSYKDGCLFDCTAKKKNHCFAKLHITSGLLFSKCTELRSRINVRLLSKKMLNKFIRSK